jgi:hypothetical protein
MEEMGLGGVAYPDGGIFVYYFANEYFDDGSFQFQIHGFDAEAFHAFVSSECNALAANGQVYTSINIVHFAPISTYAERIHAKAAPKLHFGSLLFAASCDANQLSAWIGDCADEQVKAYIARSQPLGKTVELRLTPKWSLQSKKRFRS